MAEPSPQADAATQRRAETGSRRSRDRDRPHEGEHSMRNDIRAEIAQPARAPASRPPSPHEEPRRERRPEPEPVRTEARPPRRWREEDLGPSVTGFGDEIPAFMLLPKRGPRVLEEVA